MYRLFVIIATWCVPEFASTISIQLKNRLHKCPWPTASVNGPPSNRQFAS